MTRPGAAGLAARSARVGGRLEGQGTDGRARKAAETEPAAEQPVARVLVDVALAHLDRPFDYLVPASMAADAQPGVRVKVRFAGQDVDGYVVGRADESDHPGRLTPLRRVLSAERVLSPAIARAGRRPRAAVCRGAVRRAAPRGPAAARHHREGAVDPGAGRARLARRRRPPRPGAHHDHAPAFLQHLARRRHPARGVERGARRRLADAARPRGGRDRRPADGAR